MKRILVFPYHPDAELLIKKMDKLKGFSIGGIWSFQEDQSVVKAMNEKLGCVDDFTEMLRHCDIVLLLDNYRESNIEKYYEIIHAATDAKKQVFAMPLIGQKLDLEGNKGKYIVLQSSLEIDFAKVRKEDLSEKVKYTIETPVIVVYGLGKSCCKFENQILLKAFLDQEGYNSIWISSNPLGILFGGYSMPDFLYDDHLSFEEKVIWFNHFIYQLYVAHNPDIFIIGIPEGISEFSVLENNHFAEYPLVIGSAVSVDSAVMCTYFIPKIDVAGVNGLLNHCKERFGFPVHMVSIGRAVFERAQENNRIAYLFLGEEYLQKHYEALPNQPDIYVGVWEAGKVDTAIRKIFNRFQRNPDAI